MNTKKILTIVFLLLSFSSYAQKWSWVQKIDGKLRQAATGMCTLEKDLILCGGYDEIAGVNFESTKGKGQSVEPKEGVTHPLTAMFIARYKPNGKLAWAINAFSEGEIMAFNINCDNLGNIIVCGRLAGKTVFNSTDGQAKEVTGIVNKTKNYPYSKRPYNYFIAKYNSSGKLLWVKVGLSQSTSFAVQVETDNKNNIYVRAYCYKHSIAFDKHILLPRSNKEHVYNYDLIILKYSPQGKEEWITYGGGLSIKTMNVDPAGNIYLNCLHKHDIKIFNTNGTSYYFKNTDHKLTRSTFHLNSKGELVGVSTCFPDIETKAQLFKILKDRDSNFYILFQSEWCNRNACIITWKDKYYSCKHEDLFLAKLDPNEKGIWIAHLGGTGRDKPLDMVFDKNENIIISGIYGKNLTIKDAKNDSLCLNAEYKSLFLASFNKHGILKWALNCGSLYFNQYLDVSPHLDLAVNSENKLFASGNINMPTLFDQKYINIKGEKKDPKWTQGIECYKFSDAFVACLELEENRDNKESSQLISKAINTTFEFSTETNPTEQEKKINPEIIVEENLCKLSEVEAGISGTISIPSTIGIKIYPNPVDNLENTLILRLDLDKSYTIKRIILNDCGKLLNEKTASYQAGITQEQISLDNYTSGTYFVVFEIGVNRIVKKVIIL